jgi:Tfp pilus assembly protein PilO
MTARDRGVLMAIATLVVLGAVWFLLVAPEREKASKLDASVTAASGQLASAEGELAAARSAQARYTAAYASIVSLGKAVPPAQEVPSLIYQLEHASNQRHVEFSSIVAGGAGGAAGSGGAAAPASGAATSSALSAAASKVFTQMPFTFVFNGSFFALEHLFGQLDRFAQRTTSGSLQVSGRLLTVQSVKLSPAANLGAAGTGSQGVLSGTITATAYVLPASQGLTAGASPTAPAGAASSSSSLVPSATARVTP